MNYLLISIFLFHACSIAQTDTPQRAMAITIDDLPYVNGGNPQNLLNAQRATEKILRALQAYRVPAVGFVNEGKLSERGGVKARTALLQQWIDAGMILGNHTYSHPDFNTLTIKEFKEEIIKGEAVTRKLMKPREPYQLYFRHPMTHTGDTKVKKEAIENFLTEHGYKVTPHTIENSDYIFNIGYVRALRMNDDSTAKRLRETYLDFTFAATAFAESISATIFGSEITQTLLIHSNDITADCLYEMLLQFKKRGYRFVTLDEAMSHPAYQTKDTTISRYGPTWLWRWMKSKGMSLSFKNEPDPPQWVMDLYNRR